MANNKIIDLERLSRFKEKLDIELDKKANVDGNYPTMTVGSADNLTPYGENSGAEDSTPFVFQTSGGSSDVGSKAYLRELRGNSVAFNQIFKPYTNTQTVLGGTVTVTYSNGTFTFNGTPTSTNVVNLNINYYDNTILLAGHKYLMKGNNNGVYELVCDGKKDYGSGVIWTQGSTTQGRAVYINVNQISSSFNNTTYTPQIIDLTLMFGAGNEPTSVLEFNRLFPKPYYEYNAGELLSCKANGIKNVGYNAWDEEWEIGGISTSTGDNENDNARIRSKNFIKVIQGQTYTTEFSNSVGTFNRLYFYDANKSFIGYQNINIGVQNITLSNDCCFVRFIITANYGTTYKNDIAFHLTWDSARTGYEPHKEWQYNLPNIELRSAGSVYDELKPNGELIRRVGVVDLGTLNWTTYGTQFKATLSGIKQISAGNIVANMICSKYQVTSIQIANNTSIDKCIFLNDNSTDIRVKDSSYNDLTTFTNAMSGVYLYYELATPTIEQTSNTFQEIQDIDDFGTQEFLYDSNIAIPVPQGNEFFYPVDYKAFTDSLGGREDIEYDASELVSISDVESVLTDLGNTVGFGFTNIARDGNGDLKINGLTINKATIDNSITSYNAMYGATSLTSLHCKFLDQERGFATFEIEFVSSATATQTGINIQWSTLNSQFWNWLPHVSDGYMYMTQVACLAGTTKKDCFGHFERIDTNLSLVIRSNENFATSTSYKAWIIIPIY